MAAIFKKSERKLAENHRPISLTSVPCKLVEKLIRNTFADHITKNNLFSKSQHGFISGRSCITQLLEFIEDVSEAVDNGEDVDIIYFDFKKAFDKVPHKRLLQKVRSNGIRDCVYSWINEFLTNRRQRIVVNGQYSECRMEKSDLWYIPRLSFRTHTLHHFHQWYARSNCVLYEVICRWCKNLRQS